MEYPIPSMSKTLVMTAFGVILGVAGIYIGEIDDAPGMMLIGVLLLIGFSAYGVRTVLRKS